MRRTRGERPVLITDAEPSFDEEQRARKRVYAILMVVHVAGFTAAGLLAHYWVLAVSIVVVTGALPWVAVVVANDRMSRRGQRRLARHHQRALADPDHPELG